MLFFKGKEDMGLEASLKLLDLPPDATIDDANQAYACLHRMIDQFHRDAGEDGREGRQEDMDLLTCAYEKAVVYLSDRDPQSTTSEAIHCQPSVVDVPESTDLHFTLNFSADANKDASSDDVPTLPEPNSKTVEDAISIITRRVHRTEAMLPGAQQAVEAAKTAMEVANRQHESAKQASMTAVVAAKSAKTRALLLEIEVKRAMADAIAVAEKARARVVAARKAATEARTDVDKAREQVSRVVKSVKTAAAEVVCTEDRLEKAKGQLKTLTHTLVETRSRMDTFQDTTTSIKKQAPPARSLSPTVMPDNRFSPPRGTERDTLARQQVMSDLLEIEASLKDRNRDPVPTMPDGTTLQETTGQNLERRQHQRISYPLEQSPVLSFDGCRMPILDLSTAGIRLASDDAMACPRVVRGVIAFAGQRPVKVTGKVVRQNDHDMGLRLVTRIGNHILDQERLRLRA